MNGSLNKNQLQALTTLKHMLDENSIPFIAIGGLASIAWGVRRPLVDIDIQVDNVNLNLVKNVFAGYVTNDIRHYVTQNWDIQQMILKINGINIDVCGANSFYLIKNNNRFLIENNINKAIIKKIQGISLPTMPRDVLIYYKKIIARPVDLEDLRQLGV